jgi:hypothetical protein
MVRPSRTVNGIPAGTTARPAMTIGTSPSFVIVSEVLLTEPMPTCGNGMFLRDTPSFRSRPRPLTFAACLPPSSSTIVHVAAKLPRPAGVKTTSMEQLRPGWSSFPLQRSATLRNAEVSFAATETIRIAAPPLLVTTIGAGADRCPMS